MIIEGDTDGVNSVVVRAYTGLYVAVVAIGDNVSEANDYMRAHPDVGVIMELGTLVFMARLDDRGSKPAKSK